MANFQLQDSQKVPYAVAEFDAKGSIVPPSAGDTATLTTDSPNSLSIVADATVDPAKVPANADGTPGDPANYLQTGFIVGGTAAKVGANVTSTIAHSGGTPGPSPVTDVIDVVVGNAVTQQISLGTPVNQ